MGVEAQGFQPQGSQQVVQTGDIQDKAVTGPKLADNFSYRSNLIHLDSSNSLVGINIDPSGQTNSLAVGFSSADTTPLTGLDQMQVVLNNSDTTAGNFAGMRFDLADTGGTVRTGAVIAGISEGKGASTVDYGLLFGVRDMSGASGIQEAMRLDHDGYTNVKVGLKLTTQNQGDVLYDGGTEINRLTPGTSGQFLKTQGAAANPTWANQAVSLLGAGSVTLQTTTTAYGTDNADISISASELAAGDQIRIKMLIYNADAAKTISWAVQAQDTTATGTIVQDTDRVSPSEVNPVTVDIAQHPATSDVIVGTGHVQDAGDYTTLVGFGGSLDTNDAAVFTTAWTLRLTFKYNTAGSSNSTIRYWVERVSST